MAKRPGRCLVIPVSDCEWTVLWRWETIEYGQEACRTADYPFWFPHVPFNVHNHELQRGIDIAYLRRMSRTADVDAAIRRHLVSVKIVEIVRLIQRTLTHSSPAPMSATSAITLPPHSELAEAQPRLPSSVSRTTATSSRPGEMTPASSAAQSSSRPMPVR